MKQVKPGVAGYTQIGFMGDEMNTDSFILKCDLATIAVEDYEMTGVKSRFRPVYKTVEGD